MKRLLLILLSVFFFAVLPARAQDRFDIALDQYESVCNRCLALRAAIDQGESIPQTELRSLLEQIASIRKTLSEASGEMSKAQQRRFASIRDRFLSSGEPRLDDPLALDLSEGIGYQLEEALRDLQLVPTPMPPQWHGFVVGASGLSAHPDFGVMGGVSCGKWGGYLSIRVRPVSASFAYACDSEGNTAYGQIWTSGKKYYAGKRMVIGGSYAPVRSWQFLLGLGYGDSLVLWEDLEGERVKVSDLSRRGWVLETGVLYGRRHWTAGAGLSTLKGKDWCPVICAGYRF